MVPVFPFEVNFTEFVCETSHDSPRTKLQPLLVNIFFQSIRKDMYGQSLQSRHQELLPVEIVLDAYGTQQLGLFSLSYEAGKSQLTLLLDSQSESYFLNGRAIIRRDYLYSQLFAIGKCSFLSTTLHFCELFFLYTSPI